MCGIAGFIAPGERNRDLLAGTGREMADRLAHRGPDDSGTWVDADAGVVLAHRRLSILDLSVHGAQPMRSESGRYVVVFNGEIYNHHALRDEFTAPGAAPAWRGRSDTEVMLAAFERWGVRGALERFNGMFAFALWDRHERILHLARDRLGEKPLYYGWMGNTFLFGSELKALRAHPFWRGEIDRDAVTLFLRYNSIPAPYSIYRGIKKLPPASTISLDPARPRDAAPQLYWSFQNAVEHGRRAPFEGTEREAADRLEALLLDSVRLRMEADVPLGAFLSGGVDSSTVVALMQAQSSQPVRTFSIGFHEQKYNEAGYAKAVAAHLGTRHTELYVTPEEARAVIPRLPAIYDEPFADSSQIPTFLVAQLARREVTVSLSGDGGDELFGGYNRYQSAAKIWKGIGWLPHPLRRVAGAAIRVVLPGMADAPFMHKLAASGPQEMYLEHISDWNRPEQVVPGGREPAMAPSRAGLWNGAGEFFSGMMALDTARYLPDDILVKVDRAAMAVSLETRIPLLDHRVVEFACRLPLAMKIRNGTGKWILRQVLYRHIQPALIERRKMGFAVPIDAWLRGPLRPWAEELLSEQRLRAEGILDPKPIRRKWHDFLRRGGKRQHSLWDVLMFQAWLEVQESHQVARTIPAGQTTGSR